MSNIYFCIIKRQSVCKKHLYLLNFYCQSESPQMTETCFVNYTAYLLFKKPMVTTNDYSAYFISSEKN